MIPFANAMSIAPVVTGKTRAQFDAHVATLGAPSTPDSGIASAAYLTYADLAVPAYGTPWRPASIYGTTGFLSKIVAHCFPSEAVRLAQWGKRVFIRVIEGGEQTFWPPITRNGVSTDELITSEAPTYIVSEFLYYDDAAGQAYRMNPSLTSNNGPFLYDW